MSYTHFTENERYVISHIKLAGFSLRAIGRRLGRDHTSVIRELNRNRPTYADDAVYWYYATQPISEERRHQARSHYRQNNLPLVKYVRAKLRIDWPPEAIAARVVIFISIYVEDKKGTDLDLVSSQGVFSLTSDRLSLAAVSALGTGKETL